MAAKIVLLGAGGHCKVVIDTLRRDKDINIVGIIGLKKEIGSRVLSVPVIGSDAELKLLYRKGVRNAFVTVGSVGNTGKRSELFRLAKKIGFGFPNIISRNAILSEYCRIGEGNYIAPGAIINAGAIIGNNCIVNTGSLIDHDCIIGDFAHLAPGTVLSGGVRVGAHTHIGTGTSIIQGMCIGNNTIIGAGSVVTKNIEANVTAYGVPCKRKRIHSR